MIASAPSPLVSAAWLQAQLEAQGNPAQAPDLLILDCRFALADASLGQRQYDQGHISGAHYLSLDRDLSGPVTQPLPAPGGRHPLPDSAQFAQTLNHLGMTAATQVVAYDDSRFAFAARLWWLLRYLGHDRVAVLDGGWSAWQAAGYGTSLEIPSLRPGGSFVPQPRPELLASREAVRHRSASTVLVDSRSPQRYRGEEEPIDPIAGSIPGAVNYFWQDVTDDTGLAKSPEAQAQRWAALGQGELPIVYCGSGVTACVNLLSMAIANIPPAQLYIGGWSDWCAHLTNPEDP
ncbi:MAG: sulfurtransferase [Synechococcales cyanobacterium RM1_1_8]|nr:sulfurtransferase [Synechococcales cyanobacterium RM1_1_8]